MSFLPIHLFSQDTLTVTGFVYSCQLKKVLTLGEVKIINVRSDTVNAKTDLIGRYKIFGVQKNEKYKLIFMYPFHKSKSIEILPKTDTIYSTCLELLDKQDIKNDTTTILINHEYGFAPYGELIQTHGLEYGINWMFHGCVVEENFDYHNELNEELLKIRNGEDWEQRFWDEIEQLRKLEKKQKKNRKH